MPLLGTHKIVTGAVALAVAGKLLGQPPAIVVAAIAAAVLADTVIDKAGHEMTPGGVPRRTPLTHGLLTGPGTGALVGLAVGGALYALFGWSFGPAALAVPAALGAAAGLLHLLLDAGTHSGLYLPGGRRWAYAHRSSYDPALNGLFTGLALALTVASAPPFLKAAGLPEISAALSGPFGLLCLAVSAAIVLASAAGLAHGSKPAPAPERRLRGPRVRLPAVVLSRDVVSVPGRFVETVATGDPYAPVRTFAAGDFRLFDSPRPVFCCGCGRKSEPLAKFCDGCGSPTLREAAAR